MIDHDSSETLRRQNEALSIERDRTRAAGFDLHLTKPIDLRTLDQLLAAL